ncbi:MAG: hypothetical protein ACREC6_15065 [Hyphomicrobiaceae bacterium]
MPLQNRVTPEGEILATPARGTLMGSRGGILHEPDKTLGPRRWATKQWIACRLSFKGRHRPVMMPGSYTELFFLDEATALAAGHRPCYECRRTAANLFNTLWTTAAELDQPPSAYEMDQVLHSQRVDAIGRKVTFEAALAVLPDGTFVRRHGEPHLVLARQLLPWTAESYGHATTAPHSEYVEVLTPRAIVAVLLAGYSPELHPSAAVDAQCTASSAQ